MVHQCLDKHKIRITNRNHCLEAQIQQLRTKHQLQYLEETLKLTQIINLVALTLNHQVGYLDKCLKTTTILQNSKQFRHKEVVYLAQAQLVLHSQQVYLETINSKLSLVLVRLRHQVSLGTKQIT
jgi:hypothetical protein